MSVAFWFVYSAVQGFTQQPAGQKDNLLKVCGSQRKPSSDVAFCGENNTLLAEQAMKESIADIAVVPDFRSKVQPRSICLT